MKRFLLIISAFVCLALSCGSYVFAEGETPKITEVYAMTGKLFYCDVPTARVVLTSVAPVTESETANQTAKEAEYIEIRISPDCMRLNDNSVITLDYLNNYIDSNAWFLVAKDIDGNLMIPYFRFN